MDCKTPGGVGELGNRSRAARRPRAGAAPRKTVILLERALELANTALVPLRDAAHWYRRPFAGILLDPDGQVGDNTWKALERFAPKPHPAHTT